MKLKELFSTNNTVINFFLSVYRKENLEQLLGQLSVENFFPIMFLPRGHFRLKIQKKTFTFESNCLYSCRSEKH